MRVWQREHVFHHNWETVVHAAMIKYPNPILNGVLSQDVVSRTVSPDDGVLRSHRVFGLMFRGVVQRLKGLGLEWLFRPLVGGDADVWYGSEHTEVDPGTRSYRLRSRNITFSRGFTLEERIEYRPHPEDPAGRTLLCQSATITCPWWPISGLVESVLEDQVYNRLASQGPSAIEWVIANRVVGSS